MRAWAINDFAPSVKQYIQLNLPENRRLVKNIPGKCIIMEELKYALLAQS